MRYESTIDLLMDAGVGGLGLSKAAEQMQLSDSSASARIGRSSALFPAKLEATTSARRTAPHDQSSSRAA
jgi:hypothetical protein